MSQRLRACALCLEKGTLLLVRLRDPATGRAYLFPPGGQIEPGETPAIAARRETLEETGYLAIVDESSETVVAYPFRWGGVTYQCVTHFFRATLESSEPLPIGDEPDQEGVEWVSLAQLPHVLDYDETLRSGILSALSR